MKDNKESDNEPDDDYDAENGALDDSVRFEPNQEQLAEVQRKILHVELDDLEQFVNDHSLDLSSVILPGDEKQNLIFYAIKIKNEDNCLKAVQALIEKFKCKGNYQDAYGQTLLFYACREGYTTLVEYLITKCSCDINQRDMYQQTPIYYAWRENRVQTLLKLIEHNVDIKVVDDQGQTALYYAAQKGNVEIWRLLLQNGIDINHKDKKGTLAIQVAQRYKRTDVVDFLEEHGSEIPLTWKNRKKVATRKGKSNDVEDKENQPQEYVLTVLKNGRYVAASHEDFHNDFAEKFNDFYRWLSENDIEAFKTLIPVIHFPEDKPVYITWMKVAQRILNHLK